MEAAREDATLLEALREDLGVRVVKDGCSPQGQCGCCTVLVDGAPRAACVTPLRRVAGREVVTADGLEPATADRLVGSFLAHGASQCGFCTPGILCRLAALGESPTPARVESALLAHLCRCTGWRTIVEAACDQSERPASPADPASSERRALLEGGHPQRFGPQVVLGRAGFADDTAPPGSLVAVPAASGGWAVAETLHGARAAAARVPGRRSGQALTYPVELPPGEWDLTLQTTWVEPAYLEPDASWCEPGGEPASPGANGGAFGAKEGSVVQEAARQLAERHGRPVRVVLSREDVVRLGTKRPPLAAGVRADGSGTLRVARAAGIAAAVACAAPLLVVEEVDVPGPRVSASVRAAGWAEAAVLVAAASALREGRVRGGPGPTGASARAAVTGATGSRAVASVRVDGGGVPVEVDVSVSCGDPLDEVVLRSYLTGACHMALGWVCTEAVAVDARGVPEDLTIRSFGVLKARSTPAVTVSVEPAGAGGEAVNGSDAVFAAVAAATWIAQGLPPRWPTRRGRIA